MGSPNVGSRLGTQFGPYELQSLIGVGGMGEVYRAYDTVRERLVAIKVLRTDLAADPSFQERFRRESRVAARLQEPHVIPVHDFGDIDGVLYIDMRLVEGASLKDELRVNGALPAKRTVGLITQVAAALDAAHANGLVHRDIKPENVLLTHDDFAYLVDFGIAHGGGEASVTKTGLVIGSCAYMATERWNGEAGWPSSDVYSLTCLLYECLTGRAPFEAGDLRQVMSAHMFSPPPRPSVTRRGVSPAFDAVIARGMAKNPADRYPSAGELARAAAEAAHVPVAAARPSPPQNTRQFSAIEPNPAASGYVPSFSPPTPVRRNPRFGPMHIILVVASIMLFGVAAVLATVLMSGDDSGSAPQTRLAAPPPSTTAPTSEDATSTPYDHVPGDARHLRRPVARSPGCPERTGRVSSAIPPGAMREVRLRRPSELRCHWPSCARDRRAITTTAASDCAMGPTWNSPTHRPQGVASKSRTRPTVPGM